MLEKETEEHCNEAVCDTCEIHCSAKCHDWQDEYDAFQKGAELGYNKAKREVKEVLRTLLANCPDTYSGTDVALNQKRMYRLQDARNMAEQFLKEV